MKASATQEGWRLGYRPALDGLRGIAVLLVMAQHFAVPGFFGGGHTGVAMFFVLSGFLITTLLLEERESGGVDLRAFYRRRARRLIPALAVFVAVVVVLALARGRLAEVGPEALAVLFYVANWAQMFDSLGNMSHTWSLAVEEQFYIVWPVVLLSVLALAGRRGVALTALVIIVLTVVVRVAGVGLAELDRSVDALMLGCLLSVVAVSGRLRAPGWLGPIGLAGLAFASVFPWSPVVREWGLLFIGMATVGVIASLVTAPTQLGRVLAWRPLAFVGRISYGLYLWHFAIGWEITPALMDAGWHWIPSVAMVTALSFAAALASWRYVESPFLRRRRSSGERKPARTDGPAEAQLTPARTGAAAMVGRSLQHPSG